MNDENKLVHIMIFDREKFKTCLLELSKKQVSTEVEVQGAVKKLEEIYGCSNEFEGYRHFYSDIFWAISEIDKKKDYDKLNLTENLQTIREYVKNHNCKTFISKINKLYDHTNLEVAKLEHTTQRLKNLDEKINHVDIIKNDIEKLNTEITKQKEKLDKQIQENENLKKSLDEQTLSIEKQKKTLDKEIEENKNLKINLDKQTEKIEDMQRQYITILGIFASIVLTSTAAISISTSILDSFHKGSIYRIGIVSTSLIFVLFNVIYILTRFIQEINNKVDNNIKYPNYMWGLDIACAVAIAVILIFKFVSI